MTLPEFALDYESSCTLGEVRRFWESRHLFPNDTDDSLPHALTECVEALRAADKNATFRFSDLPGELQNVIYEDLLRLKIRRHFDDGIYERTTRAQTYALGLQGSAAVAILQYQKLHADRVVALAEEKTPWPSQTAPRLDIRKIREARSHWEKDARKGQWYGLGSSSSEDWS